MKINTNAQIRVGLDELESNIKELLYKFKNNFGEFPSVDVNNIGIESRIQINEINTIDVSVKCNFII